MSELHVRQIKAALHQSFDENLDLSDLVGRTTEDRETAFLSRALAAFAIYHLTGIGTEDAAAAVCDGFHDNGIDAVYRDPTDRVLYLVQSKWQASGRGSIDRGEIQKFLKGFRDLINARWERFSQRVQQKKAQIEEALNDAGTRIVLVVAYTGQDPLSNDVATDLQDVLDEINNPIELVSSRVLRQSDLYHAIAAGVKGAPIDLEVQLYEWGQVREPYPAFYGQVAAADVASWFAKYHQRLLAPNIRFFLGATEVNAGILSTALTEPENLWYFNNGITALCAAITKKPIGGSSRDTGLFECTDLRIVNGAQTVGALFAAAHKTPDQVARARVPVRIISLEKCPEDFDKSVTRYNNTQNRIDRRDFVALDLEQERIRNELQLEGVDYVYKSGANLRPGVEGFDLVEATAAQACGADDVSLAVQAKREIGKLWDDLEKPPYKLLFNGAVSGPTVWRRVQIMRVVERITLEHQGSSDGRTRLLATHGNRFLAHVLFRDLPEALRDGTGALTATDAKKVERTAESAFQAVRALINTHYPDAYLASLFKNLSKCRHLLEEYAAKAP